MASTESDDDKELQKQLRVAGNRLLNNPPSSDVELLALLEQVESDLSRVEQSPSESMKTAISPSLKVLVAKEFMNHPNEDIKIAVASCISEITRVTAPDAPYDDNQMKDVFQLIVSSFEKLSDKNSRSYDKRISMLETVSKVRSCVVMLDLECDSLITEMLQHFFKTVRDYHPDMVYSSMENIMTLVLEESEEITLELLSPILAALRKDNEDATIIARRLGEKVLENCAVKIRPTIVQLVNSSQISLKDYTIAVENVCQEPSGDVGNNDLNTSIEHSVPSSKLTNGTSQNEASHVVSEAATLGVVNLDTDSLPKPITSNGVTSAKTKSDNSLESDSSKLPRHSDENKQSKSDDGPSNTEHCSMGAENTIESEDTTEKVTKTEGESLNSLPVEAVSSVVNDKEPSIANAVEPLTVNATEASTVSLIEPSLAPGNELAISSSNIAHQEQDTPLLGEETQSKEVGSAKAVASPSVSNDRLSKESLVPSIASLGIVADKMSEGTIDSELKPSESTIDSDAKAHKRSSKKNPAGILEGTSSTPVNTSKGDSGANGIPEPKPKTLRVKSKEFDISVDLADKSRPKKVGRSKESMVLTTVSADSDAVILDDSERGSKADAHKLSGNIEPEVPPRRDASSTRADTSKADSGTDTETTPRAEVSTKLVKRDTSLHGSSKKKISKKSGKRKANVEKDATTSATKDDSGTDTETTPVTPLAEVSTKLDKKEDNLHGSSKKQISKKSGKGKDNVEKDETKSAAKDMDKDTISTSKTATKNKGKETLAETLGAISKRKRTPAKVVAASDTKESGENLVGKRIKVWWPDDKEFYEGTVESWNPSDKKHKVIYSDGDEEVLLLKNEKWQLVEVDSVTDVGEGADALTPDTLPETPSKKKSKKNIGSRKQANAITPPKSGGVVSSSKSKGAATKASGKSKDHTKEEPKTKYQAPKGDVKSKNVGASSSSKKTELETPKASTKSKGKSPKSASTPSSISTGKGKSPDSSKANDAKRKTPESSSKAQESKDKSGNKRRKK